LKPFISKPYPDRYHVGEVVEAIGCYARTGCAVKEGTSELEEVKATLDYQGKTYAFCSVDEKAEFISSPAKYTGTGK
jgi:YHS domain-containing protein